MNRTNHFALTLAIFGIFIAAPAIAQQAEHSHNQMGGKFFEYLDKNKDGQISREEFDQARTQRQQHRQNQQATGQNHQTENKPAHMRQHLKERREKLMNIMFNRADRNDDGVVSKGEFLIGAERLFEHLDRNNDGILQKNELKRKNHPNN